MASSNQQRVRRNVASSPTNNAKQGPMKAILPVSLMRQVPHKSSKQANLTPSPPLSSSRHVKNNTSSLQRRSSPDNRISPERRSLGSPSCKEKCRTLSSRLSTSSSSCGNSSTSPVIRRTASVDAIYLSGQWPKDAFRSYCGHLMVDKSTQTPDEWEEVEKKKNAQKKSSSSSEYQLEKFMKQRLHRMKEASVGTRYHHHHHHHYHHHHHHHFNNSQNSALQADHSAIPSSSSPSSLTAEAATNTNRANPIPIPPVSKPLFPRMRSSVEGLNQEIEKIVLKGAAGNNEEDYHCDRGNESTLDGHRAPIADLFLSGRQVSSANNLLNSSNISSNQDIEAQGANSNSPNQTDLSGSASEDSASAGTASNTSSGMASRCQSTSPSVPIIPGFTGLSIDNSRPSSHSEGQLTQSAKEIKMSHSKSASPESTDANVHSKFGTSPHINKFERQPPDGCEKVSVEEYKYPPPLSSSSTATAASVNAATFCPIKPNINFILKPSLCSAFCPLDKTQVAHHAPRSS